jgi:two-component system OmpR family sensor kinase
MTISSLRTRLFLGMTAIILVTAVVGGWFAYRWAYNETIEMQDSVLLQIGSFVKSGSVTAVGTIYGVDAEAEITVIEILDSACSGSDSCRMARLPDGLHLSTIGGQSVRAFLTTAPDNRRFAVTQRTALRDEIGADFAVRSLLPIAVLIPCLMLIIAIVIAGSLRPVVEMAREVDRRSADDLTPLPTQSLPSEIAPFIASINGQFERVKQMMVRERRFIAEAAHELRSPITAISLQVENVGKVELPAAARERVAILEQGVRRVRHLLDQLLSLARQDIMSAAVVPVVDLAQIARDAMAGMLPVASRKDVDVGFALLETANVQADPFELSTLVRNLIDNAIRFTPPGGRVDIDVHPAGELVVFQLADTGPGVSSQDIERLFEPFYRGVHPVEGGTGLGLAIVKRIVNNLGGSISLQNRASEDSTGLYVTVRLPNADAAA